MSENRFWFVINKGKLEYKVQKFKGMNSEQQATINKLNKRNEYLKKELNKQIMLLNIIGRD